MVLILELIQAKSPSTFIIWKRAARINNNIFIFGLILCAKVCQNMISVTLFKPLLVAVCIVNASAALNFQQTCFESVCPHSL